MEIQMNAVNMVPVEWLMKNLTDSVDSIDLVDNLFDLFHEKVTDYSFGSLVESILDNGFTTPICVQALYGRFVQGNGHHRFAAAILMCLDEIPVYFTDSSDYMCSHITDGGDDYNYSHRVNAAWRKLFWVHLFDREWCEKHNVEKDDCWKCYAEKKGYQESV